MLLAMVGMLAAPQAFGLTAKVTYGDAVSTINGGEFIVKLSNAYPAFESWCLEFNEPVKVPGTYTATLSNSAELGGVAGGSPDPICAATAWLYSGFLGGTIGYLNTPADADEFQNAIWFLEGEKAVIPAGNKFLAIVPGTIDASYNSAVDDDGTLGVGVVNLTALNGENGRIEYKQSMLSQFNTVPDAGATTLILLGASLTGLGLMRRRLAK